MLLVLGSCSTNDPVVFDDAFVYLADENGNVSSTIDWNSNNYLATYYVYLVCPSTIGDVSVSYELVAGDGLHSGVDYRHIASTASPLYFARGIYRVPIRIEWLRHELDATKDNTLHIVLTMCTDERVHIGRPGPDSKGSEYVITKR